HEDSLVLLHRPTREAAWIRWGSTLTTLGSATDGYGRLDIDSVATGEYALAWRKSAVGMNDQHRPLQTLILGPNPANEVLHIDLGGLPTTGTLAVLDANGRTVHKQQVKDQRIPLRTVALAAGNYTLNLHATDGTMIGTGRFVVQH
ncbi:MAG TPA: T9SS type A sorting domain-containing protein, partial [Flavobacteriales bacterium]|nr:T9SS type A sorting domain-containing protein [Flavobacteriales bacterium]